jgi:hypothetical protein
MFKIRLTTALLLFTLGGCASAPQVVETGAPAQAHGKTVSLLASEASSADDVSVRANALVISRFAALGAAEARDAHPDYLLQVTFSHLPPKVGVSRAGARAPIEGSWASPPAPRGLLPRRGGGYALNIVGLDAATGKPAFAVTATDHGQGDPQKALVRLVDAAFMPPAGSAR